jgi:hypothetical protein
LRSKGGGIAGNYFDPLSGQEYWVSGVKIRGSNMHPGRRVAMVIDEDAVEAYQQLRNVKAGSRPLSTHTR